MDTTRRNNELATVATKNHFIQKIIGKPTSCGKQGFAGIMVLAAFLLWLSPAYGGGTITENFTNNQYNTDLWDLWNMGQGITAQVASNRLEVTVGGNGYAGLSGVDFTLIGDFEMRVDFTLINWPANNETQISMGTWNLSPSERFQVARGNHYWGTPNTELYFTLILGKWTGALVTGPTTSGKLRMVRTGNTMQGYYWDGSNWQLIKSATDPSLGKRVGVTMGIGPYGNNYSGISAKAAFSNIRIDYTTLGPSFEQGNPNPGIMLLLLD